MSLTSGFDITTLPQAAQKALLVMPYFVSGLAYQGHGKAVIDLIKAQPLEDQKEILASFNAVYGLADNGYSEAVVDLIKAQPSSEAQKKIFAAQYAELGLKENKQSQAVVDIKASWKTGGVLSSTAKQAPISRRAALVM